MHLIVSYTRADQELVRPLVEGLRRIGHDVWLDKELSGGESWWASILGQIRASDAVILAVSEKELESDACQREVDYARRLGKPVLPVMVAPVDAALLPSDLVSEQFVDFTHPSYETAFMLAGAISRLPKAPPVPEVLPEPPPVPMSYLNEISGRVYGGQVLTMDEQLAIVGRLRQALQVDEDRETAVRLLRRFKSRQDILYATAREIDTTLAEDARRRPAETLTSQVAGPQTVDVPATKPVARPSTETHESEPGAQQPPSRWPAPPQVGGSGPERPTAQPSADVHGTTGLKSGAEQWARARSGSDAAVGGAQQPPRQSPAPPGGGPQWLPPSSASTGGALPHHQATPTPPTSTNGGLATGSGAAQAPTHHRRRWIVLSTVAATVLLLLVAGIIGIARLLTPPMPLVPPAAGATVSTSFVQMNVTTTWRQTKTTDKEVDLTNNYSDGLWIGYGNSTNGGVFSNQSGLSNFKSDVDSTSGVIMNGQCVSDQELVIGDNPGEELGLRYTLHGEDLCEVGWIDYVSNSLYYYWIYTVDYSRLSAAEHEMAAMMETTTWKV